MLSVFSAWDMPSCKSKKGLWRLVQCGSRCLVDVEARYAITELELVAVVWAMAKCRNHLKGLPQFTVMTDHRPLIPILTSYTLDAIDNPRLQRLKKIAGYTYTATWCNGKDLSIPDALSRSPVDDPSTKNITRSEKTCHHVRHVVMCDHAVFSYRYGSTQRWPCVRKTQQPMKILSMSNSSIEWVMVTLSLTMTWLQSCFHSGRSVSSCTMTES